MGCNFVVCLLFYYWLQSGLIDLSLDDIDVPGIAISINVFVCLLFFAFYNKASRVWVQNKVDESKHEIHSQVDAITAGTASVVNLTAGT